MSGAGRLSFGLTHISAPGGRSRPGARPLLFLDRRPSRMDAAMVTQVRDFKQAEQERDREAAGSAGIRP